ncbi:MAG: MFS transporter [Candidatus Goldiibacteriota bacterium]
MKELIKNRNFKNLMAVQTIEQIGDSLMLMSLFAWVMAMPGDQRAQNMSILIFWVSLPIILIGPFSGVIIDRFKRKTLLLAATVMKGSFILLIWFFAGGYESIPLIYGLVFMKSFATQFFIPAKSAFVPAVVNNDKKLIIANSISATLMVITQIMTYAAAGIAIAFFGVKTIILIAASMYVPAVIMIFFVRADEKIKEKREFPPVKKIILELWDGLKFLFSDAKIKFVTRRVFAVTVAVTVVYIALTGSYLGYIIKQTGIANKEVEALGFVMAAVGMGLVLGVIVVEKILKKIREVSLIRTVFPIIGAMVTGLYFYPNFYFLLVCAFVSGACAVMLFGIAETVIQKNTPVNMRGRIFASYYVFRNSGPAAATGISGLLLLFMGEKEMVLAAGLVFVIYGAVNLLGAKRA